jgi:hypothetical protein
MIPRSKCLPLNRSDARILTIIASDPYLVLTLHQNPFSRGWAKIALLNQFRKMRFGVMDIHFDKLYY